MKIGCLSIGGFNGLRRLNHGELMVRLFPAVKMFATCRAAKLPCLHASLLKMHKRINDSQNLGYLCIPRLKRFFGTSEMTR